MVEKPGNQEPDLNAGAGLSIDSALVPATLRRLIPIVQKWAFGDLELQDAFVQAMIRERPEEVRSFNALVDMHRQSIVDWSLELQFTRKNISEITDAEWEHPYWSYQTLFKIREITDFETTPEIAAFRQRVSADLRSARFPDVAVEADAAFRRGDYLRYVELMESYEDLLSPAQKTKLTLSRDKSGPG